MRPSGPVAPAPGPLDPLLTVVPVDFAARQRQEAASVPVSTLLLRQGLEADVVLLCDVDGNPMSRTSRNLYVAASRAKNRSLRIPSRSIGDSAQDRPETLRKVPSYKTDPLSSLLSPSGRPKRQFSPPGVRIRLMANESALANYKIILYVQEGGGWVAEIPAIGGCYALMDTREEALKELEKVFRIIQEEYAESGKPLPADRTELLVHA